MNPNEILSLLGVPAVLLPIRKGTKAPTRSKWQKLTFASTQTPAYQRSLSNAFAIGVSLGEASQNLCSIDFDDDSALETFLALNPLLKSTLRTRGQRGANLWIIIEGPLPRSQMMKNDESSAIGEWRANGCHTIITGRHKDGGNYETLVKAPPQTLGFLNISWPPNWVTPPSPPPPLSEISISSKNSAVSKLSMPNKMRSKTDSFAQRVKNAQAARDNLNKTRHFATFYEKHIGRVFSPQQGQRNDHLIKIVTHLFYVVGKKRALELCIIFHHLNQDIFLATQGDWVGLNHLMRIALLRSCS